MAVLPTIDAHHHLWDLANLRYPWLVDEPMVPFRYGDYSKIRRNYLPEDYRRDSARQNIVATVHMEAEVDYAQEVAETKWIHEIAAKHGFPNAVIGHARLETPGVDDVLRRHASYKLTRSIRQKPASARSAADITRGAPGSMSDPAWRRGYALLAKHGLSFDLQTPWWHLEEAAELARAFPETTIILNHTGLPADRSPEGLAGWRAAMTGFAAEPNTRVKISGIGIAKKPWTVEDNRPVVLDTIKIFGVARCMFASNFPVDGVVVSYDTIFDGFRTIAAHLPEADQRKLFCENAAKVYRISL
jgi:predicted TIM-barrel fold metal-dependent hydrolase